MKTILFSILILFSVNGFAFNWEKVTENKFGDSFYVDVDSIKKHNGLVYYWSLSDYLEPTLRNSNSVIGKYKINCIEKERTELNATYYSQSMGKGKILFEETPDITLYLTPNGVGYIEMKFVCDY